MNTADVVAQVAPVLIFLLAITVALNALTLGVAGIALFTSQLALAEARLAQVAPAWALGLQAPVEAQIAARMSGQRSGSSVA